MENNHKVAHSVDLLTRESWAWRNALQLLLNEKLSISPLKTTPEVTAAYEDKMKHIRVMIEDIEDAIRLLINAR